MSMSTIGLAVAGAMFLLKMPNPLLWGALAGVAEFIPYLGATAMVALLSLAGLVAFDQIGEALLVPVAYLGVNLLQSQFIAPLILGRRLTLNPVAIFIGLVFWWWIWGSARSVHRSAAPCRVQDLLRSHRGAGTNWRVSR
jgi:predicted PurR-regulated permease PerM